MAKAAKKATKKVAKKKTTKKVVLSRDELRSLAANRK